MSNGRPILFLPLVMLCMASPSLSQVSTAELSGTVTDPTGAIISRAKIVAINADTGFSRDAVSDVAGAYVMTLLPAGNYNLSLEGPGFRRLLQSAVALEVTPMAGVG